jgi:hypothetical protein
MQQAPESTCSLQALNQAPVVVGVHAMHFVLPLALLLLLLLLRC